MLIIAIVIVFDISEKIDDFLEKKAPLTAIIFDYYLNFIPYFVNLFSPLFTFISVIFFTAKLASNTEIIAILGGGVSFKRLLWPYLLSAGVLAMLSYTLGSWIIPKTNAKRLAFENKYTRSPFRYSGKNIHRQISPGVLIYLENYNNIDQVGTKFSLERIRNGKMTFKLVSDYIQWDSTSGKWRVNNYSIREIREMRENLRFGVRLDTSLGFKPDQFNQRLNTIETMNSSELNKFIALERLHGSENINFYLIEKYRRIAFPFATFILTLIGVSLASRKVRGGIGLQIGMGLLLSFSYILFMQVSTTFATSGSLSPFIAVWLPNFLFAGIALFLVKYIPK